jgi:hypothetical protein
VTAQQVRAFQSFGAKLQEHYPSFKGAITPEESVRAVVSVFEKASVANGDGGSFVSHLGTKQWV